MQGNQPVSNIPSLTDTQRDQFIARMKKAWATLPAGTQAKLKPLLNQGHQELGNFLSTGKTPEHRLHNVLRMKSFLTDDWDGHPSYYTAMEPSFEQWKRLRLAAALP